MVSKWSWKRFTGPDPDYGCLGSSVMEVIAYGFECSGKHLLVFEMSIEQGKRLGNGG